jgi:hypothetical protein
MAGHEVIGWATTIAAATRAAVALLSGSLALGTALNTSVAQTQPSAKSSASPPPSEVFSAPQQALLTAAQLDHLMAPIALYPDALLAQMLPASAYPLDIIRAKRWLDKNKPAADKRDFTDADKQDWDVSVKSMIRFPDLIRKMSDELEWTTDIGEAFVAQPKDVSASIQRLRKMAKQAGALKPTPEQHVEDRADTIVIQPAKADTIYVPQYDSTTVYTSSTTAPLLAFATGVVLGAIIADDDPWDWHRGYVYPPVWIPPAAHPPRYHPRPPGYNPPGYNPPGYNPPGHNPPAYRPPGVHPWQPDPYRYRPSQRLVQAATAPMTPIASPPVPPPRQPASPAAHLKAQASHGPASPAATMFDHAGNTHRTNAFRQRGGSSRHAAGLKGEGRGAHAGGHRR